MLGITPVFPTMGMGVFTGIFRSAALLISTVCLAMAEVPVLIPPKKQCYRADSSNPSLLAPEFG